ncbi:GyrI-like domain-containing protein [Rossellomorea yichunensis]|jgi:predicted transcriptional regulator YdeE|uniref:GyrI-like domain-containing protein n=1 Tax=Rossellomorea yichunensis TaxID=3077331 RepID=UPI0028DE69A7|nr:GyrI-like domain-containing protein [Rossellomorea sp. YC4-1]MDT9024182.1 GyrI-like domain-containing protein [Rossellomorea sp. YC4-1]
MITRNIKVKKNGELNLIGFRVVCPGDQYIIEIPKAASKLKERVHEIQHLINKQIQLGAFIAEDTTGDLDGYWVGMEVEKIEVIPPGMVSLTIPPQTYVSTFYQGTNHGIRDAYRDMHEWAGINGYARRRDLWHLEKFHRFDSGEQVEVELLDTVESK